MTGNPDIWPLRIWGTGSQINEVFESTREAEDGFRRDTPPDCFRNCVTATIQGAHGHSIDSQYQLVHTRRLVAEVAFRFGDNTAQVQRAARL